MKHIPLVALFSLGAVLAMAADDSKSEPHGSGPANPILAESAGAAQPTATSPNSGAAGISPATAARIAALAPKYTPASAKSAAEENPLLKEPEDKPKNGIVRLPAYLVRQPKMPALSEAQVLTPKGRVDLAYQAFPGLRFGSFWIFRNDGIATAMLEEELMAERARQIADLMTLLPANRPEGDSPRERLIRDALTPRSSPTEMDSSGR